VAIGFVSIVMLSASPVLAADSVRSEIEAANKVFEAAVSRSDGPGVAALYTDNAQLLPAQSGFVTGTEAIGQFWQAAFDSGMKGVSLVTMEVEKHGDTAYEVGELDILGSEATPPVSHRDRLRTRGLDCDPGRRHHPRSIRIAGLDHAGLPDPRVGGFPGHAHGSLAG
jgi:ketosteroid isomerase-like protein